MWTGPCERNLTTSKGFRFQRQNEKAHLAEILLILEGSQASRNSAGNECKTQTQ